MTKNKMTLTEEMIKHFKKEIRKDNVYIVMPRGYSKPRQKWDKVSNDDIEIIHMIPHPQSIEWKIRVHGLFKFAVVKNQHGFHIQQLQFD